MQHKVLIRLVCVCLTFAFVTGAYSDSESSAYATGASSAYAPGAQYLNRGSRGAGQYPGSRGGVQYPDRDPIYGYPIIKQRYPFGTYLPIAVQTSNLTAIQAPPLRVYINKKAVLQAQNNGYTIYITPKDNNAGYITGGPYQNTKYVFALIAQNNDGWPNDTRVSTTLDGIGWPYQIQVFYFNPKYENLTNALNYPDGLAIVLFDIRVEAVLPNKQFFPYQNLLQQLVKYNSTAQINNYGALYWLYSTLKTNYFSYPGAFIDIVHNRKQYFCASVVQGNVVSKAGISNDQWDYVARVENIVGQLQANPIGLFPGSGRPVVQVDSPVIILT